MPTYGMKKIASSQAIAVCGRRLRGTMMSAAMRTPRSTTISRKNVMRVIQAVRSSSTRSVCRVGGALRRRNFAAGCIRAASPHSSCVSSRNPTDRGAEMHPADAVLRTTRCVPSGTASISSPVSRGADPRDGRVHHP